MGISRGRNSAVAVVAPTFPITALIWTWLRAPLIVRVTAQCDLNVLPWGNGFSHQQLGLMRPQVFDH